MIDRLGNDLDTLLDEQREAWLEGKRVAVEDLLAGSSLRDDSEAQLDLIYNEIVLREELGEQPAEAEYTHRYPHIRSDLERQFEVHRAVHDRVLTETARLNGVETLPDHSFPASGLEPHLPDYDLLHLLGQGGMGVVYKARQRRLRRHVAIKMFRPGRIPSPREITRFQTEAEAIARLQHPNIVQIFEIGQANGLPYLALELAERGTLADRLQQLPFTPRAAAELIQTLANAMQHAHEQHIVHRDLKPTNVLFTTEGFPKITDFGLAKMLENDTESPRDATRTGEPIGTPRYMSPEQAAGQHERIGPTTDVYALGTLLYECLTGQVPFVATSVVETLQKIRTEEPLSPRRLQPAIPRDLETICSKCLQKEASRRYASARCLADDLGRFLNGEPILARPISQWEHVWKWCRRRPAHAALIALGIALLICGIVAAGIRDRMERQRIAGLRDEVDRLMIEGQQALQRDQEVEAASLFRSAWIIVQGEPELRDYQTGVSGWLDHSRVASNRQHWKQRIPPREFDEKRDKALLLSLVLDPQQREAARQSIAAALELTLPSDPAWQGEREQLVLLEADLIDVEYGTAQALAYLEETHEFSSRLFHTRRAAYLDRLGRGEEANAARRRAEQLPPNKIADQFFSGMGHVRRKEFADASRDFEAVLDTDPEHFSARLFLAICALHQNRPGEAKVGLTACVAQRPRFAWCYLYRAMSSEQLGEIPSAERDFRRATDLHPGITSR